MKKVFGVILIIVGIVSLFKGVPSMRVGYELIGGIIGITLVSFLPAYFLLTSGKKELKGEINNNKQGSYDNSVPYSLYADLKEKCSPKIFLNPYQPEKFSIANELYAEILTNENNEENLKDLRNIAIEKLGIKPSTEWLVNYLKNLCNPNRYIDEIPYNKDKVAQANLYYKKVNDNENDIIKLEEIKQELEILGFYFEKEGDVENYDGDNDPMTLIIGVAFIVFILVCALRWLQN